MVTVYPIKGKVLPLEAWSAPEGSRKLRFPDFLTTAQEGKAVLLQAWGGPEGSRKLRFPDFMTTAQDGGKVVSLTYRPHVLYKEVKVKHSCYRPGVARRVPGG
jgi:hypothetical protein